MAGPRAGESGPAGVVTVGIVEPRLTGLAKGAPSVRAADTGAVRWDGRLVFDATGEAGRLRQAVIAGAASSCGAATAVRWPSAPLRRSDRIDGGCFRAIDTALTSASVLHLLLTESQSLRVGRHRATQQDTRTCSTEGWRVVKSAGRSRKCDTSSAAAPMIDSRPRSPRRAAQAPNGSGWEAGTPQWHLTTGKTRGVGGNHSPSSKRSSGKHRQWRFQGRRPMACKHGHCGQPGPAIGSDVISGALRLKESWRNACRRCCDPRDVAPIAATPHPLRLIDV